MAADGGLGRCVDEVVAAGGDAVSQKDAKALLSLVDERAERIGRERGIPAADAARLAGKEISDAEAAAAAVERRNALLNLTTRIARRQQIEDVAATVGGAKGPDLAHAVMNQVVARNAPARGNRLSAEALWRTRQADYAGGLSVALKKAGLLSAFRDGKMEQAWGRELYELSMRAAGQPDHVGATGNAHALQIATIVHGLQEDARRRLNSLGAWIGDYSGYITRTVHDMDKVRRAGFDAWRDFITPRLDERTFEGVTDRGKFLRDTWNALSTGVHLADREQVGMKDAAFSGPGNLADRLSQGRKLHFTDATSWMAYQRQFGRGSLAEQMTSALDRSARQEALLRRWGTNPEAEFQQDFRYLEEKFRDTAPDQVIALRAQQQAIQKRFDFLTGEANRPANQMVADIASGVRAVQSMAKLGGVAFTHLSTFATKAAELRYQGVGWLESYGNSLGALFAGRGLGEQRELADLLLAGTEGMHGHMLSRFHADDAPAGTMGKLANRFFELSGLTYLVDGQKAGAARLMARHLGTLVDRDFAGLPPQVRRGLASYDISPAEWDALRQAPNHTMVDGRLHLTPDAALRTSDAAIAAAGRKLTLPDAARPQVAKTPREASPDMLLNAREDLALKLHAYYADVADRSVITPGIDERALLRGGAPGSLPGEAMRFLAQFKTWGTAAVRQGIGREIYGGQGVAGAVGGIVHLALAGAVMGYLTMTLKDLMKGQSPRPPLDPRTVFAAMMQGGGFGILGDYAFGDFSRFGHSLTESLAGPAAGTLSDLANLVALGRGLLTADPNARAGDAGPEALRILKDNTPFINLFYVRRALDYLLLHSLQESMNPGYLRRAEKSAQQRTGRSFLPAWAGPLSAKNHLPTFGH